MQKKLENMDMTKGHILKQIVLFFIPVALGTFFQQMYNTVDALVVCCMVNIVLDLLFVSVLRMGVAGVALATVAAQSVSSILIISRLLKSKDIYKLSVRKIRFYLSESLAVLSIGVPAALQSAVMSVSNIYRESMVNAHGADAVAAITVLGKIDGFIWLILAAIGVAVTTFVGQNYGAGRLDRVKASIKTTSVMALVSMLVFTALFIVFRQPLYRFFGAQGAAFDIGMYMVLYTAPFYTLYVPMEILASALRGMGKTFVPSVISMTCMAGLSVLALFIARMFTDSIIPVIICYPATWGIASLAITIYYKQMVLKQENI